MFYTKKHLLLIQIIFLLLSTPSSHGWWLWGDDSESVTEEVKVVENLVPETLETGDSITADTENKIDEVKLDMMDNKTEETIVNIEKEELTEKPLKANKAKEKTKIKNDIKEKEEESSKKSPKAKEVFHEKAEEMYIPFTEVEKGEEAHDSHIDDAMLHHEKEDGHFHDGQHNEEYDQRMFLGEDKMLEYRQLTPDESKNKLKDILLNKVDKNGDKLVSVEELTIWIKHTGEKSILRRTELFWNRSNPEGRDELSWDEYRARQYGFLTDRLDSNSERRWVGEDDVNESTLKIYLSLEARDKRRWTVADRNKNLRLDKSEFLGFLHPEVVPYMSDILVTETMAELDKDADGKLNLTEYVLNIYGDTKNVDEWNRAGIEFRRYRDKDGDGFIDKHELKAWILPESYDQHETEAEHLIRGSDTDYDKMLSIQEALDRYSMFVSSQATNFGEDLKVTHDEL